MADNKPAPRYPAPRMSPKAKIGTGLGAGALAALGLAMAFLPSDEGKRNVSYADIVGVPTSCYGHTGTDVRIGERKTDAECKILLQGDAEKHLQGALRCSPELDDHPQQLAAVTRLTFNIGIAGYCKSSIARLFKAGQYRDACGRFMSFNKIRVGVDVPGMNNAQRARLAATIQSYRDRGELCLKDSSGVWRCSVKGLTNRRQREQAQCLTGL